VQIAAEALDGPWAARIVWRLFWGGKSFSALERDLGFPGRAVVARELEALEGRGIVERRVVPGAPLEYALTPSGEGLKIVVGTMYQWGLLMRDAVPSEAPAPASPARRPPIRLVPRRPAP